MVFKKKLKPTLWAEIESGAKPAYRTHSCFVTQKLQKNRISFVYKHSSASIRTITGHTSLDSTAWITTIGISLVFEMFLLGWRLQSKQDASSPR